MKKKVLSLLLATVLGSFCFGVTRVEAKAGVPSIGAYFSSNSCATGTCSEYRNNAAMYFKGYEKHRQTSDLRYIETQTYVYKPAYGEGNMYAHGGYNFIRGNYYGDRPTVYVYVAGKYIGAVKVN
ncbi:MAG: hypothetical protein IIY49_12150 [Eubacterium sp.]|nr:hypothetical protein [Eubacterium sp.]